MKFFGLGKKKKKEEVAQEAEKDQKKNYKK